MITTDRPRCGQVSRLVLWPHRSLSSTGALLLLGTVGLFFVAASIWAVVVGTWPVAVYAMLALVGFSFALRQNNCAARFAQVVEFDPGTIRISEAGPAARSDAVVELNPCWTRVLILVDRQQQHHIALRQGSRCLPIGNFLPPEERAAVAAELEASIADLRTGSRRRTAT